MKKEDMLTRYIEYEQQLEMKYQEAYRRFKNGKNEDALELLNKLKKNCEKTEFVDLMARCNRLIGGIYMEQGNVVDGMKLLNEASAVFELNENYHELSGAYNSMAGGFSQLSLYAQANMYHSQALAIATKMNDKRAIGFLNLNITEDYLNMNQPKNAQLYLDNAYKTFIQIKEDKMIPPCDYLFGLMCYKNGNYGKAKELFDMAITGAEKTNDAFTLSKIYEAYADLNKAESNFGEEQRNLDLAIICYRKMDNHKKVMELMKRKGGDRDEKNKIF